MPDTTNPATPRPPAATPTMLRETYLVRDARLPGLRAELDRLIRRAARLKVAPLTFTVDGTPHEERVTGPDGRTVAVKVYYRLTLSGESPCLNGWTFHAALDHGEEAGTVLRAVPGVEVPVAYRQAGPNCDHCRQDRRRKSTYLLAHEDGRQVQVGSSCLSDFLGHTSAHALAAAAEFLALAREACETDDYPGQVRASSRVWVREAAAIASAAVSRNGWCSRKAAGPGRTATADDVAHELDAADRCSTHHQHSLAPGPEHLEEADRALEWVRELRDAGRELNDYEHNLSVVTAGETASARHLGILVSLIPAYRKATERELTRRQERAESRHVGTVGKREVFDVTVLARLELETAYGTTALHKLVTPDGAVLKWFASTERLDQGMTYRLKATVKEHGEWKGVKETTITRGVVVE